MRIRRKRGRSIKQTGDVVMLIEVLRFFAIICVAVIVGKIVSKIKLPAILGWLITGILFGPYLTQIVTLEITEKVWYICTFLFVSLVFAVTFLIAKIPVYLAFIFGGIALATAPAPALSIVNEYKTRGL